MTPEFFEMIKTRLEPRLARKATNYRAPIRVGEKLALTIRYLATGESYTLSIVPGDCRLIGSAAGGPDRNPAREAKRQRDYLKDYFNNEGAVAWQDGRI